MARPIRPALPPPPRLTTLRPQRGERRRLKRSRGLAVQPTMPLRAAGPTIRAGQGRWQGPGPNEVEARFIMALPTPVQWLLVYSYRTILCGAPLPMQWRDAHISLSTALAQVDRKLLKGLLSQRMMEVLTRHGVVSDWQQGALPGSNTGLTLFMAQRQLERGSPTNVFSFEACKAFDTTSSCTTSPCRRRSLTSYSSSTGQPDCASPRRMG